MGTIKTAILMGVDAAMFVDELKQLSERRKQLTAELEMTAAREDTPELLHADLGPTYRDRVARLTAAFEDKALEAQAFERIRALIEAVVLTPEGSELSVELRGELASMLELCACAEMQTASAAVTVEALQIRLVAGTGFEPVTFRL